MKLGKDLNLLKEFAIADFKLRYRNTFLGFFWIFVKPLLMLLTLYLVFTKFIGFEQESFSLFLLLGIIMWNFFSEATVMGMNSIINKSNLIKKINIRREVIVISACINALFGFLLNLLVFFILLIINNKLSIYSTYLLIGALLIFILSVGAALFLSAFYSKYRDIGSLWEALLLLLFWISPIVYSANLVPEGYLKFYLLNPLARIIELTRNGVIYFKNVEANFLLVSFLLSISVLLVGYYAFKLRSPYFAEEL